MADDEDIKRLRPVFQMLDKNQQGFLTLDDLKLQMMDYNETQHSAEKIFKAVDTDCKGRIDFQDFLWAASDIEKVLSPENLRIAFNMFAGMNKSGQNAQFITKEQMIDFFDAQSEIIDVRHSSLTLDDQGWTQFFSDAKPAEADKMTYLEFSTYMTNQFESQ